MSLSTAQIAILKVYALGVPEMVTAMSNGDDIAIKNYFNTLTSIYGWKTYIAPEEYLDIMDWSEVDSLTVSKARIWEWVTSNQTRAINAANPNVRNGVAQAFAGSQATTTRNGLLSIASRLITLAESLLVVEDVSTGTSSDAKTMTFEGNITTPEASLIRIYGE